MARAEIHVGDYDTEYVLPIYDNDLVEVNFNPSGATTKTLQFKQPGVTTLVSRTAVVEQRTINSVPNVWCLVYTVTKADVETAHEFHQATGIVKMQAILDYTTGLWHSNIVSKDFDGEDLRIYPNLA